MSKERYLVITQEGGKETFFRNEGVNEWICTHGSWGGKLKEVSLPLKDHKVVDGDCEVKRSYSICGVPYKNSTLEYLSDEDYVKRFN